jgi:hypothetical protein
MHQLDVEMTVVMRVVMKMMRITLKMRVVMM